ncbi:MCE family protein [Phytohabitans houttuyneae]|uniref:ABC transporter substrate-binding protein n=1 Tax=Phytohabitans houttuyneae TaxID=1076126 RepID=A0A6V8K0T8_9ACTN|nr:MCE family protein [Phytohabitans houttuyneae]GFJ77190.1 ABC transporter substrate-binding protein [Phytohabitans houttuyneae]
MRHRVLGIAFVLILVAGLAASVLQYRKAFTPVTWVTLRAERAGMQLSTGADVKLRGVVVGDVRSVDSDGGGARLRLALDPDLARQVPGDVTARLLPKTLFGERYVALVAPPGASGRPIHDGAVITQDRSQNGVELERVLDEALPLLQSIRPDRLAAVLGALAAALDGRGEQLGRNLELTAAYLGELNKQMPVIAEDVRKLSTVLGAYDAALPDLLSILRDVTVTAGTVVDQRAELSAFLASATGAADTTRLFLDRHDDQLIRLGDVSRPVLELLAAYAPEYPCLMRGLVALQPRVEESFEGGKFHITLEITKDGGKYERGRDEPVYGAKDGPQCRGLPSPGVPAPGHAINDGYDYGADRSSPKLPIGLPSTTQAAAGTRPPDAPGDMGSAGTAAERDLIKPIIGAVTGVLPATVPDIAVLLWGPLLRGAVVNAP